MSIFHPFLYFTGPFATMDNLTVNALCNFTIDHHRPMVNRIDRLDIKTFGHMLVVTDREATTTLQGTTLTVRSGASVGTNFSKFLNHLIVIFIKFLILLHTVNVDL